MSRLVPPAAPKVIAAPAQRPHPDLRRTGLRAAASALLAAACLLTAPPAMAIEEPAFERALVDGANELRRYAPMIVAETWVTGTLSEGSNAGFRAIAGYIFGANRSRSGDTPERIAMTAPVTIEPRSERIAMTAPVTVDLAPAGGSTPAERSAPAGGAVPSGAGEGAGPSADPGRWRIHFVMPAKYTLATLPVPTDPRVALREVPAQQVAARTFSGFITDARVAAETEALRAWMAGRGLQPAGPAQLARYNPPWSVPFLRRHEILVPVR